MYTVSSVIYFSHCEKKTVVYMVVYPLKFLFTNKIVAYFLLYCTIYLMKMRIKHYLLLALETKKNACAP